MSTIIHNLIYQKPFKKNLIPFAMSYFKILIILYGSQFLVSCNPEKSANGGRSSGDTIFYESMGNVDSFRVQKGMRLFIYKKSTKYNEWGFMEYRLTGQDTINVTSGIALLDKKFKLYQRTTIESNPEGSNVNESWNEKFLVDSLSEWGVGRLYTKSFETMYMDEGTQFSIVDTIEISFITDNNSLTMKWSQHQNETGEKNSVFIKNWSNEMYKGTTIDRIGVLLPPDINYSSTPFKLTSTYLNNEKFSGTHFLTLYDANHNRTRCGQIYYYDEKTIDKIKALINPDSLSMKLMLGQSHGLWKYFETSDDGYEIETDQIAFFKGRQVGVTFEDFLEAEKRDDKSMLGLEENTKNDIIGEKCTWCKTGRYINGTCNICGTVSAEKERQLKKTNDQYSSKIANCPNKSVHYKYQYPYTCSCGYVGK